MSKELKIVEIIDKKDNNPDNEFVRLQAISAPNTKVNLGHYAIVDNTFDGDGDKTNVFKHFYKFPNLEINRGDFVRLYSGKRPKEKQTNEDGSETYMFSWDAGTCIWNNDEIDEAFLLKIFLEDRKPATPKTEK